MSYVSVNDPLPRNSQTPMSACEIAARVAVVSNIEAAVANAQAASAQIAPPSSFASLGQGVVNDATNSQAQLIAANTMAVPPKRVRSRIALSGAPQVLPLNVSTAEYSGCSIRGTDGLVAIPLSQDQQRVVMPPRAPTDTILLTTGGTFPSSPARAFNRMSYGTRGMGVVWGDSTKSTSGNGSNKTPVSSSMLALLGLVGVGLYAMTRKGR